MDRYALAKGGNPRDGESHLIMVHCPSCGKAYYHFGKEKPKKVSECRKCSNRRSPNPSNMDMARIKNTYNIYKREI